MGRGREERIRRKRVRKGRRERGREGVIQREEREKEGGGGRKGKGTENTHTAKDIKKGTCNQSIIFMWSQAVITEERMVHLKKPISPDPKYNHLNHLSPKDSEMSTLSSPFPLQNLLQCNEKC